MFESLSQGVLIGVSAGLSPGPLLALYIGHATRTGWRRTLPAAFAPLLSDGPIILVVLLLLSQVPDAFIAGIRLLGGFFLLYLAWGLARRPAESAEAAPSDSHGRILRDAVLINLLNPNPYIFWATVLGPTLILRWRENAAFGLAYGLGFYGAMIACFMFWIIAFGSTGRMDPRLRLALARLSGIGMAGFGVWQIIAGLGALQAF